MAEQGFIKGLPTDTAMDWPLSREEKKTQILRLYNEDVRAADTMLSSGEEALEALREELDAVRQAAGVQKQVVAESPCRSAADVEIERLRAAVESAAAVLRAIVPVQEEDCEATDSPRSRRGRARSEGARSKEADLRPALRRSKSREGPKRRVSFGKQPEEEPPETPESSTKAEEEEEDDDLSDEALRRKCKDRMASVKVKRKSGGGSSLAVHFAWFVVAVALAFGVSKVAFRMGSEKIPGVTLGDPTCWVEGFRPEICCLGPGGNSKCWDATHTYERCCLPRKDP
mmetsp:Transcript_48678/g.87709  ORF Transcript_48678/g.87709 Transcript_48678/m.87709 type:complete len:286 (-) Transcript_48678:202-1059(-)